MIAVDGSEDFILEIIIYFILLYPCTICAINSILHSSTIQWVNIILYTSSFSGMDSWVAAPSAFWRSLNTNIPGMKTEIEFLDQSIKRTFQLNSHRGQMGMLLYLWTKLSNDLQPRECKLGFQFKTLFSVLLLPIGVDDDGWVPICVGNNVLSTLAQHR